VSSCTVSTDLVPEGCPHRLRLCQLRLEDDDDDGYGFTLYAGTAPGGQFIGEVDHQSPAERAGLLSGDRVVEVNGVNVETESHSEVDTILSYYAYLMSYNSRFWIKN